MDLVGFERERRAKRIHEIAVRDQLLLLVVWYLVRIRWALRKVDSHGKSINRPFFALSVRRLRGLPLGGPITFRQLSAISFPGSSWVDDWTRETVDPSSGRKQG